MSSAKIEIDKFREGNRYQPPPTRFLVPSSQRDAELAPFGPALREETSFVREQIVNLVADVGKRTDTLFSLGGQLIREPSVIALLIGPGLTKNDLGRQAALTALQELVPAPFLKPYETALVKDFLSQPASTAFLLMAKLKPAQKLLTPDWPKSLEARIAAAALGDTVMEQQYNREFTAATIPEDKARLARILGLIGTPASLRTLAEGLRTSLIIDKVMAFKRSVRVDILQALSYNFPDQPVFYESQINDDEGYARAEQFCEQRLGAKLTSPRPPYMKISGYPIPPR